MELFEKFISYTKHDFEYSFSTKKSKKLSLVAKEVKFYERKKVECIYIGLYQVVIDGCVFSLDRERDKHMSYYDNFQSLKDIRKEKLEKIKKVKIFYEKK